MRVCILSSRFYPQIVGSGVSAHLMANSLANRGHEVVVLTDASLEEELTDADLPYRVCYVNQLETYAMGTASLRGPTEEIYRLLRTVSPDILHVCNFMPMLLVTAIRHLLPYPIVFSFYNTPVQGKRSIGYFKSPALDLGLASYILKSKGYDRLIAGSKHYLNSALSLGAPTKKTVLSYLGTDINSLRSDAKTYTAADTHQYTKGQLSMGDEYILLPSRIAKQKGILEAIQALAILNKERPIKLLLTGMAKPFDTHYAQQVWREAEQLGVTNQVIRPAKVIARHHLPFFIKNARVVVIPSYYEGLGLSAIEALVLGTPLVATDTVGLNEIVWNDINGLTTKPRDPAQLATATRRLLKDRKLANRLSAEGLKRVHKFNIVEHIDFVEQTYDELIIGSSNE